MSDTRGWKVDGTPIESVLVLGAGTAGLISALMIREQNPDLPITVLYSARIGHIMVGEGTFATTPTLFHDRMGLDRQAFFRDVRPTPKLGARFLWGKHGKFDYTFDTVLGHDNGRLNELPIGYSFPHETPFTDYCLSSALMSANRVADTQSQYGAGFPRPPTAYHIENGVFVGFLTKTCLERNIRLVEAEVEKVETCDVGVESVTSTDGRVFSADLYVDCSGFSGQLIHKALEEPYISMRDYLFCDRAVVGGWDRSDEPLRPYTTAETMDAGWSWQIEHRDIINRGYVYCSEFIDDEAAEAEFKRKNPKVGDTRIVRFETRRIRRSWVANTVAIGNANGFVEPLEATNIQLICNFALRVGVAINRSRKITHAQVNVFNAYTENSWFSVRDFLAGHYKFNTMLDTPFWRHARDATPLGRAKDAVDYYRSVGPDPVGMGIALGNYCLFGASGWLTILLGCGVPFTKNRELPVDEAARMTFARSIHTSMAETGLDPAMAPIESWARSVA